MKTSKTAPLLPPLPPLPDEEAAANASASRHHRRDGRRMLIECSVFFLVLIGGYIAADRLTRRPFDSAVWRTTREVNVRERMSADLVQHERLKGLSYGEVVGLLGKPDSHGNREWDMSYKLGTFIFSDVMLVVKFDGRKRVSECGVQTFDWMD